MHVYVCAYSLIAYILDPQDIYTSSTIDEVRLDNIARLHAHLLPARVSYRMDSDQYCDRGLGDPKILYTPRAWRNKSSDRRIGEAGPLGNPGLSAITTSRTYFTQPRAPRSITMAGLLNPRDLSKRSGRETWGWVV